MFFTESQTKKLTAGNEVGQTADMSNMREIAGMPMIKPTAAGPIGHIQAVTGLESKPCFTCRFFNNDRRKLLQFLHSRGLKPDENGFYETPIVGDFQGRRSLKLDPRSFGFCSDQTMPTHMNATCEQWDLTRNATDLARKVGR